MILRHDELAVVVDATIQEFKESPVDLLNLGDTGGELTYLINKRDSYIKTMADIVAYQPVTATPPKILELGSFLGVLCIGLAKVGYQVAATDIPEFVSNQNLRSKFEKYNIELHASNLRDYLLPFPEDTFDVVIMCQVLEHLNFNPLPVIQEINRILKVGGLFYVSLPNVASLENCVRLIRGDSIHPPIDSYYAQLDPNQNMIVGLHWREYTALEVRQMLTSMNFRIEKQYYDSEAPDTFGVRAAAQMALRKKIPFIALPGKIVRYLFRRSWTMLQVLLGKMVPRLRGNHTTFAVKTAVSRKVFHFTDATTAHRLRT